MFRIEKPFPGVAHITDAMGVSFTLIEGENRAILFDTGYGTEDVWAFVQSVTEKPVKVMLSHGHHDHILGARWFGKSYLCSEDLEEFRFRTGMAQRLKVSQQAKQKGVQLPSDYLTALIPEPKPISFDSYAGSFEQKKEDLGRMIIRVIHVPGHTPGSVVLYVEDLHLLLTGDNWNPCTWIWFPSSAPVRTWRRNMNTLIGELKRDNSFIHHVLCSHQPTLQNGKELEAFLSYMTDERLDSAPAVDMGVPINTHHICKNPEGWTLLFDMDKNEK